MSLNTILGLLGGGVAGFGAAYFIQNGKVSKLKEDVSRYTQASLALVSAESELKDAKSRILILEQSDNQTRREIEQSFQREREELEASYQVQMQTKANELGTLRSLKEDLERELSQTRGQLENVENSYFNQMEALKQSYQVQIEELQQSSSGAEIEPLRRAHAAEINDLQQAYENRLLEIEQVHQGKIYELEQAYQTQILEIEQASGDRFENVEPQGLVHFAPEPAATTAEVDALQTFIDPSFTEDEEELTATDEDFLDLLPQEENPADFDDSVEDLFSLSNSPHDMDLFNSLELDLSEPPAKAMSELETAEADLDFLNFLDDDNSDWESLPSDDSNVSLDDLFDDDLLSSAWDSASSNGQDEERESSKPEHLY